jgi:hypothetical protein
MARLKLFIKAVRAEAVAFFVSGSLFVIGGVIWTIARWAVPTLKDPEYAPWLLYLPGVALLFWASHRAWSKEYDRANLAEQKLSQTKPYFFPKLHDFHKVDVDPFAAEIVKVPEYMLRIILEMEPHRRPARNVRGRLVAAGAALNAAPMIDGPVDNGYNDTRGLSLRPRMVVGDSTPACFIALELVYEDSDGGEFGYQAWYWKWDGARNGLFYSDVNNLSSFDTDRFVVYLGTLNGGWGPTATRPSVVHTASLQS